MASTNYYNLIQVKLKELFPAKDVACRAAKKDSIWKKIKSAQNDAEKSEIYQKEVTILKQHAATQKAQNFLALFKRRRRSRETRNS